MLLMVTVPCTTLQAIEIHCTKVPNRESLTISKACAKTTTYTAVLQLQVWMRMHVVFLVQTNLNYIV